MEPLGCPLQSHNATWDSFYCDSVGRVGRSFSATQIPATHAAPKIHPDAAPGDAALAWLQQVVRDAAARLAD